MPVVEAKGADREPAGIDRPVASTPWGVVLTRDTARRRRNRCRLRQTLGSGHALAVLHASQQASSAGG
jgi:hypothetical protein